MNMQDLTKYPFAIFDLDGTLVDSMPYWRRLGRDYLLSRGVEAEADLEATIRAMNIEESAVYFQEHYHLQESVAEITAGFNAVMEENYRSRVPLKPGAAEYLQFLHDAGINISLCSATPVHLVELTLNRLQIRDLFTHITSCDEAGVGKYRPDVFLLALKKLGASPAQAVMYEDADYAVRTAVEAGLHVAAVYDAYCMTPPEEIRRIAEFYIEDYRALLPPVPSDQ